MTAAASASSSSTYDQMVLEPMLARIQGSAKAADPSDFSSQLDAFVSSRPRDGEHDEGRASNEDSVRAAALAYLQKYVHGMTKQRLARVDGYWAHAGQIPETEEQMKEVVKFLRDPDELGLSPKEAAHVISMVPIVLNVWSVERLRDPIRFLRDEAGISKGDLPKVICAEPQLLQKNVDEILRPAWAFWVNEVGLKGEHFSQMAMNFAAQTWLTPEALRPRWRFASEIMNASLEELIASKIPYFRSDLDKVVAPRHFFLEKTRGRQGVPLEVMLRPKDKKFCEGVNVTIAEYKGFLVSWPLSEQRHNVRWIQPHRKPRKARGSDLREQRSGGRRNTRARRQPDRKNWREILREMVGWERNERDRGTPMQWQEEPEDELEDEPEEPEEQEQELVGKNYYAKQDVNYHGDAEERKRQDSVRRTGRDDVFDDRYDDESSSELGSGRRGSPAARSARFYDRYDDPWSDGGVEDDRRVPGGNRRFGGDRNYGDFDGGFEDERRFGGRRNYDDFDGGFEDERGFRRDRQGYGRQQPRRGRPRSFDDDDRGFRGGARGFDEGPEFDDDRGFRGDSGFRRERRGYGRQPARIGRPRAQGV